MKNFNLIEMRKKRKLTQIQVAKKVGIKPSNYQRYEYGIRLPNVLTAISIGEAVGIHTFKEFKELWDGNLTEQATLLV